MSDEPTFSVVVAAHNAAATLPATVRSVLAQTRSDFELVVVDDGSVDATEDALRETTSDARIVYLRQEQLGPAAARNAGIDRARGRYVSLLDSDDLWLPTYLETMAHALESDPGAALAYTDAWRLDDASRRIFRRTVMSSQQPPLPPPQDPPALLAALLERNFVYTSATLRRATLHDVGGFATLTRSEDYELWLRVAASGRHFVRPPGVLAVYRDRPGSRIHDPVAMLTGRREIYDLVVRSYDLSPELRTLAAARLRATTEELAELEQRAERGSEERPPSAAGRIVRDARLFRLRPPRAVARAFGDLRAV